MDKGAVHSRKKPTLRGENRQQLRPGGTGLYLLTFSQDVCKLLRQVLVNFAVSSTGGAQTARHKNPQCANQKCFHITFDASASKMLNRPL